MFRITTKKARVALGALAVAAVAVTSGCATGAEIAETAETPSFPTKDISMVVPYAAGGVTDISARALAKEMETILGVTVVVENKPGASGITGLSEVSAAKTDGYTIAYSTGDAFVQSELRTAPYTFDSFVPVAGIMNQPYVLVTSKDSKYNSLEDLADADRVTYAVSGIGTPTHINIALMFDELGVDATAVPFDGNGPAMQAVVGGQTDIGLIDSSVSMPFVETEDVRPLGVVTTDGERLDYLPDTPVLSEADISTSDMTLTVWGIAVPTGTDEAIVEILRDAALEAAKSDGFVKFASANYMPLLEGDVELNWYESLADTAKATNKALKQFGISLQ